jgi:SAM-dependent methyltransferase
MNPTDDLSAASSPTPRMYADLATWWPLLSAPEDYEEEAAFFRELLDEGSHAPPRTLLELGSGGGNTASHLKRHYRMTLVDRSPAMLAVSQALNPTCEHLEGDMRTVRLGRLFDGVFIHDALDYVLTADELRQTVETAAIHCRPGGVALFVPDHLTESFKLRTEHGGHDGEERGIRYLEWMLDPDPFDNQYETHYAYLLREGETVHVEHDRHLCGFFSRDFWLQSLRDAGFESRVVPDQYGRYLFLARRV